MSHGSIQRSLACLLILCILAISGIASAQSLRHDTQHSHHQKSTHSTVLCSWMCAAGQAGEAATVLIPLEIGPQEFAELPSVDRIQTTFASSLSTRAPPAQ